MRCEKRDNRVKTLKKSEKGSVKKTTLSKTVSIDGLRRTQTNENMQDSTKD